MSSLMVIAASSLFLWLGYSLYARRIDNIFKPDSQRKTPAHVQYDGVDYVPAKHWTVLFGHHFSSIAGAGPVVGPVLAVSIWGWAPTLLWVVLGTVFIGGVHDYCVLMVSVRHKGHSIADFAEYTISKNAKLIFLSFVWIALILVISVFTTLCAQTFVTAPEITTPSLGLIPVAYLVGFLLYTKKKNQLWVTLSGLLLLVVLIFLGSLYPVKVNIDNPIRFWSVILLTYAYLASVLPVQILLQPRDYLSAFLLFAGLLFGYIGIVACRPAINFPAYINFSGNVTEMLWPVLFVTVACGAISGFHALVAGGTTSKQISNELDAKKIGYGGMVAEGLVAVMALLVVACAYGNAAEFREAISAGGGPVDAFAYGYGKVTNFFMGGYGTLFAVLLLNAFILTTLDTATRIARYLTEELFKVKNRYIATLAVVALSGWLGLSGKWNQIWPVFGAANQLIAALAMIVVTSWLLSLRKPVRYTLFAAAFMLFTTICAIILKIAEYIKSKNHILMAISVALLFLSFVILYEALVVAVKNYRRRHHA